MPEKKPRRPRATAVEPPKRRKVTMWLPVPTAKKLRHAAVERGVDIGQIAAPLIDADLAGEYYAVRTSALPKPSTGAETAPEVAVTVLSQCANNGDPE
jgi:hypothetical protein